MSYMGHNFKVPIHIHGRYLQIILKFAKCKPPWRDNVVYWKTNGKINNDLQCEIYLFEGRGKWIMDYGILPVRTVGNPESR